MSTPADSELQPPASPRSSSRLRSILASYRFPLFILTGVVIGAIIGLIFGERAAVIKPFGTLFINMMFTLVVPLVFFSISSAVAGMSSATRLGKILGSMLGIFAITGIISSIVMIAALWITNATEGVKVEMTQPEDVEEVGSIGDQLVSTFVVDDFSKILSAEHMLALIVFAVIVGVAASSIGEAGKPFAAFLSSGAEVFLKFTSIIMYYAPIGLGAYFAALIGELGAQLVGDYVRVFLVYYPVAIVYFLVAFTLYSFLAGGRRGIRRFWSNIIESTAISLGTSSSVAAIPANLRAGKRIGVPRDIRETIVPIGATIHMEGSSLSAILKIAFLFAVFGRDFFTPGNILIGIAVALLAGMVMAGIPSGGFIGELMIITLYGFPAAALPIIQIIGTVIDPPATTVNSVGDQASSMLVARALDGKGWMDRTDESEEIEPTDTPAEAAAPENS
ncbi:dicarboxylate/amino acid:cation symporter [Brevibacterium aurantiacum]|uniref:H(+):sodium-glutamate symporter n=1 Tax=Brevibacterium aurantiacum TaxID=273384 RepID=A0A1D7W251_BREAU|nr:dicarboxylate/amino acid:cation symporter [Brevibacterium aurantiacum]AOP53097.1 H(+):sodium-glutamate symporter [Brevibacterium aurantiacum]RCS99272.1 dicarboxylate/amino acid:cation symporter [Brevibacterium aurantiacum]